MANFVIRNHVLSTGLIFNIFPYQQYKKLASIFIMYNVKLQKPPYDRLQTQ